MSLQTDGILQLEYAILAKLGVLFVPLDVAFKLPEQMQAKGLYWARCLLLICVSHV